MSRKAEIENLVTGFVASMAKRNFALEASESVLQHFEAAV
jgi:hypothetical protein